MRAALAALALTMATLVVAPALAGPCDHSYDTDRAGHSCGGRAADQRNGGR